MKKLLYFIFLIGGLLYLSSCEKEAKNPGDFSLKSELEVRGITSKSGKVFDMEILRSIDSTYQYFYEKKDTLKDESGNYVLEGGKYQVTTDSVYYNGSITAKFIELKKIVLEPELDTITVALRSNAKWKAPMPSSGGKVQWFFTQNLAGGGDGEVIIAVTKNKNYERTVDAEQYILTSDSTIMYKLVFGQKGEKD